MEEEAHIVLLSGLGNGHLIPMATLAKHLHHHYHKNFSITLITQPTDLSSSSQSQILKSLPDIINVVSLPPLPNDIFSDGTNPANLSVRASLHNLPHLRQLLKSFATSSPPAALIVDMFDCSALDIAREFGVSPYIFFTCSCFSLAVGYSAMALDSTTEGEFRDMVEPVRVPGCVPVRGRDLPEPFAGRGSEAYKGFLRLLEMYYKPDGILMNSFEELEPGAVGALKANEKLPRIYPVGPLVWTGGVASSESECVRWLDRQPSRSVVYVSFGSGGTLTREQTEELALGLELSGLRFLWVVKAPNDSETSGSYFGAAGKGEAALPVDFLPDGFLERTEGVGMVVPDWAPQVEVLGHEATGGFVTHCGWNSALESVTRGVPMIAWPLFAEQMTNAVLLADDLKVALRVGDGVLVGREEIGRLVRSVMGEEDDGKELRSRVRKLRDAALVAVEEGGLSFRSLSEVASYWNKSAKTCQ